MLNAQELHDLSDRSVAAWNRGDLDEFYSVFREDVIYHGAAELRGVDALRAQYDKALAFVPDLKIQIEFRVVDPDGSSSASLQTESGKTADGTAFGFRGMTFFRYDDEGLVAEVWEMTSPLA